MRSIRVRFSDGIIRKVPLIDPMRPSDTKRIPRNGWIAEKKIDGSLTFMYIVNGAVAYVNRRGTNKTEVYPELIDDEPRKFRTKGLTIIQGEVYTGTGGQGTFEDFLKRDLLQDPEEARRRQRKYPLKFGAFDILVRNSEPVTGRDILERKKLLKGVVPKGTEVKYIPHSTNPEGFVKEVKKKKLSEGVVFKKVGSTYKPGKVKDWLKLKFKKVADTVVMGYEKGEGKRKEIGVLKVGVLDRRTGKVKEVAKVGTGFTDEELKDLKSKLDRGRRVFAKVEYMKVGSRGRLRAPVFAGLREDITVADTHL
jgi:ATP-dependent DNA ligase